MYQLNKLKSIIYKLYDLNVIDKLDIFLFLYLIINPIFNIIQTYFPSLFDLVPNGSIFIIRCLILVVPIIRNFKKINILSLIILSGLLIACTISSFSQANFKMMLSMFMTGESLAMFLLFIYISMNKNYIVLFDTLYYSSYVILFSSFTCLAGGFYGSWSGFRYMEFSHSVIVCWAIIALKAFKHRSKVATTFSIISGGLIAAVGNRAILLNIGMCVLVYSNIYFSRDIKRIFNSIVISGGIVGVFFFKQLTTILADFLAIFNINSYSLVSLSLGDFFSSSTRIDIWKDNLNLIAEHPFLGNGIAADRVIGGSVGSYAHNVFLELWVNFGIIIGSLVIILIIYAFYFTFKHSSPAVKDIFIPYALTSIVILLLSKSLYILPEFWISIALICSYYSDILWNNAMIWIHRRRSVL